MRYIGITTSHGRDHEQFLEVMRTEPLDFVQFSYNIEDRVAEEKLLPLAQERKNNAGQPPAPPPVKKPKGPNKTELAALTILNYEPQEVAFEGKTFDICGGCRYTPDWIDELKMVAIEVKAEYIASRDSRRRFDEAKHLHPDWTWIWIRKRTKGRKGRRWEVEVY